MKAGRRKGEAIAKDVRIPRRRGDFLAPWGFRFFAPLRETSFWQRRNQPIPTHWFWFVAGLTVGIEKSLFRLRFGVAEGGVFFQRREFNRNSISYRLLQVIAGETR